jgi:hypothetical protein
VSAIYPLFFFFLNAFKSASVIFFLGGATAANLFCAGEYLL